MAQVGAVQTRLVNKACCDANIIVETGSARDPHSLCGTARFWARNGHLSVPPTKTPGRLIDARAIAKTTVP